MSAVWPQLYGQSLVTCTSTPPSPLRGVEAPALLPVYGDSRYIPEWHDGQVPGDENHEMTLHHSKQPALATTSSSRDKQHPALASPSTGNGQLQGSPSQQQAQALAKLSSSKRKAKKSKKRSLPPLRKGGDTSLCREDDHPSPRNLG